MSKFSCQEFPERLLLIRQDKPSCSLVKQSELRNKDEWAKFLRLPFGFGSGLDRQSSLRGLWEDSHEQLRQFRPFQGNLELGRARSCQQGVSALAHVHIVCLRVQTHPSPSHHASPSLSLSQLTRAACVHSYHDEGKWAATHPPMRHVYTCVRPSASVGAFPNKVRPSSGFMKGDGDAISTSEYSVPSPSRCVVMISYC